VKLLLSSMIWVEETRQSNSSYEFAQRQTVVLDGYKWKTLVSLKYLQIA